jgi:hypothetical protein
VSVVRDRTAPKTKRELREIIAKAINVNVALVAVYKCKVHGWDANVMTSELSRAVATNQALKQIASELRERYHLGD